jgi:hypothetical protein
MFQDKNFGFLMHWHQIPKGNPAHNQSGAAFLLLVTMLLGAMLVLAGSFRAHVVHQARVTFEQDQRRYLDDVLENAHHWYQRDSLSMEVTGQTLTEAELLQQIAPDRRFGVRALVSNRLNTSCPSDAVFGNCVPYRVLVIWLPPISSIDQTTFNQANGAFVPDQSVLAAGTTRIFDTKLYQQGLTVQISELLKSTAGRLQNFARAQQSVIGTSSFENYFRSKDCSRAVAGFFPCIDTYQPITNTSIPGMLGMTESDFKTPWGDVVQISNLLDSNNATVPYSLSIRASSPWGQTITYQVQQTD